jgi:hypothetical protein
MARAMPSLNRRALLASVPAAALAAARPESAAAAPRAPVLSTAPERPSPAVIGDAWLRDGQAWRYAAGGWVRGK